MPEASDSNHFHGENVKASCGPLYKSSQEAFGKGETQSPENSPSDQASEAKTPGTSHASQFRQLETPKANSGTVQFQSAITQTLPPNQSAIAMYAYVLSKMSNAALLTPPLTPGVQVKPEPDEPLALTTSPPSPPPDNIETPLKNLENKFSDSNAYTCSPEETRRLSIEDDDEELTTPRLNSHGKVKTHKCKQCGFVATIKKDFWEHVKIHIKPEKMLTCPRCPFVTEYKHHLEYHMRNHAGSKPYKCDQCEYSCVNKSMLNSHLKSHSTVYQYRCRDCHYVAKYCHSFKVHLRKYKHEPAAVLNPDGSENPYQIIDVYGTRRGPKLKTAKETASSHPLDSTTTDIPQPNNNNFSFFNQMQLLRPQGPGVMMGHPFFPINMFSPYLYPYSNVPTDLSLNKRDEQSSNEKPPSSPEEDRHFATGSDGSDSEGSDDERMKADSNEQMEEEESSNEVPCAASDNNNTCQFCKYCGISFQNTILYKIHMSFHDSCDPFKCSRCGVVNENSVQFFVHLTTAQHS